MSAPKTLPMKIVGGKTLQVPAPGFGTYTLRDPVDHAETIARAIKNGFRHLDCAWEYATSEIVGQGIKLSGIPRSELFITSKFFPQFARPENVEKGLDIELKALGVDYLDLFLAHFPVAFKPDGDLTTAAMTVEAEGRCIAIDADSNFVPDYAHCTRRLAAINGHEGSFRPTWRAMKALVATGKVRAVGVSNFNVEELQEIMEDQNPSDPNDVPISCNQIEVQPWYPNTEVVEFMHANHILPVTYSPLATLREGYVNGVYTSKLNQPDGVSLIAEPVVLKIAEKYGITPGAVLHSFVASRGAISLSRTYSDERMKENLDIRALDEDDKKALAGLEKENTEGKSVIMTFCYPPVDFGDVPLSLRTAAPAAKEGDVKANGSVDVVELVNGAKAA